MKDEKLIKEYYKVLDYLVKQMLEHLKDRNKSDHYIQGRIDLINEIFEIIKI